MKKNERLMSAISFIDEKYVKEAESKMKKNGLSRNAGIGKALRIAASIAIFVGLGLFLFLPVNRGPLNVSAYGDSEYYPLIEKLEPYRYNATKKYYDNNFELILGVISSGLKNDLDGAAPEYDMMAPGEYVEATDNQVSGVIEADLMKTTDKYIFRLGQYRTLEIFSIAGADSELITSYTIPKEEDFYFSYKSEMYLSTDCTKLIVIDDYRDKDYKARVGIVFIDITDVTDPYMTSEISIDGQYNTSRLVGDKLLMISEYYFSPNAVDYSDPSTFVPTVTRDGERDLLLMDEILVPDSISGTRYSVVASIDVDDFEISGVNGLLNFYDSVYVSEENVYVSRTYNETTTENRIKIIERKSDIVTLGYNGEGLNRRVITVSGSVLDQYSMDEREGYLRVVTSTYTYEAKNDFGTTPKITESASLFIVDLENGNQVASVENFAPDGDEVVSVRFDGDDLYVCTAIIATMTDPVYFFDLSDYSNITYTDTGIVDGFSTSLINLGEGFLLGIGQESWRYNKVEVYEEQAGEVKSVSVYQFDGEYSTEYKSYLVNREENFFGFCVVGDSKLDTCYVLLHFDGYEIHEVATVQFSQIYYGMADDIRAIVRDGVLYVVTGFQLTVVDISIPIDGQNQVLKVIKY